MTDQLCGVDTSAVVLIGCHAFEQLESLPAVKKNLTDLARLFTDPTNWGIRQDRITVLSQPSHESDVLYAVRSAANAATDTLIVYYAGHGLLDPVDQELYLSLPGSRLSDVHVESALRFEFLRRVFLSSAAEKKVLLLDCCYSGRAMAGEMGAPGLGGILPKLEVAGTCLITACSENARALAPPGEPNTAFTGALLKALEQGVPGAGELLDMTTLYEHVLGELRARSLPLPQQRSRNTAARICIARNRAALVPSADDGHTPATRRSPRFPPAMPEVWGDVPRRNTRFTGRESLLNKAHHLLQGSESGAGVLTLHGMPGVGKTQLAAEYAHRFGSEYDVVWWVNAWARVEYRRLVAELAAKLGLSTGAEYAERLRAVRDSLRRGEPYSRWLLVLDGADEPDQISDLVPSGPGHVLITSRNLQWSEHNSKLLEVPVYDRDESVAFVRRRAPRLTDAGADQLAEASEDLPLLLDQAAGWLNDSDQTVTDYIGLLENGVAQDALKVSADFPVAFPTAWSILLNKLNKSLPASVDLLRLCTFFAPGFIPVGLLKAMPRDDLPDRLVGLLDDPLLWNRAINQLRQYSVVRLKSYDSTSHESTPHEPASGASMLPGDSLYLHRMVHQIVRTDMPEETRGAFIEVARRALAAADPGRPTDTRLWDAYAEIVPHLTYADVLNSEDTEVQHLVLNCLRYMYISGDHEAGIKLGERAITAWRSLLGETHPRIWELTYHHTNLLRVVGSYARAETLDRTAVGHLRQEHGELDPDHLRAVGGRAADLWGLGRYDEALEMSQRLHATYVDLLGAQDSRTLDALHDLGSSLRLVGRYPEALDTDRETVQARRSLLKGRHPWTLLSEASYAIDLRLLGRYAEAEARQEMNVREYRVTMGADNPYTLRAEHNLALCHYRNWDRGRAEQLFSRVLEAGERRMGAGHPSTLAFATSQSFFAREHGDIDQAHQASASIIARYEELLVAGHPLIAGARVNHALVLRSLGEREQAHALIEQALADMTAAIGVKHPHTLGCAINASALRNLIGDTESAAELSKDTFTRATETLGRTHPLTLSARIAYAADLRDLRHHQKAEKNEQKAIADLIATLGSEHVHTISARARNRPHWDFEPLTA
ncbi:FxSxx-COOH system tetratricopeptide repeat protein [Streptomyces sp. NPDC004732]|uniref:FxSxx-COOH system tetratricopeptide repeat protein n=1 Tax=Streptomyces sp. NPDC004732 TaxID=3154290 RepID=UPI0033BCD8B5